jgi:hypothetical protein
MNRGRLPSTMGVAGCRRTGQVGYVASHVTDCDATDSATQQLLVIFNLTAT